MTIKKEPLLNFLKIHWFQLGVLILGALITLQLYTDASITNRYHHLDINEIDFDLDL